MATTERTRRPRLQSLGRGLAVLECLVRASGPLTTTEVGRRCQIHQTTASRILNELVASGHVRRTGPRGFAPGYGLLALGMDAAPHFDVVTRPRLALDRCAELCPGLTVSLCLWWRGTLLYFDQTAHGHETQLFQGADYPLHLSSPGLLFMAELPAATAVRLLAESRRKFGWERPTPAVPTIEHDLLETVRPWVRSGTLVLRDWARHGHVTAAIRLADHEGHPFALAIAGPGDVHSPETLRLRLAQCRPVVEQSLAGSAERAG